MMTWIEVADSAIKIGLGILLGGGITLVIEMVRWREERRRLHADVLRSQLIQPIVDFVDQQMAAVGEVYWAHIDGREARLPEKMAFFQAKHGAIEARVAALADEELSILWPPFTRKVVEVRIRLSDRDVGDPYEKMKEAIDLGGRILGRLFDSKS